MYKKNVLERRDDMKRLVVEMEDKLHTAIKIEALKQGVSAKDYIIALIKKDLETKKEQTQ
jgi:predicted HicB family RNase H-like nuclease